MPGITSESRMGPLFSYILKELRRCRSGGLLHLDNFMDKKRDHSLDFACGLMTINMILYHVAAFTEVRYIGRLLFFFMPWFFFKAGMFNKANLERKVIVKSFKRLMIPFIFFSIIGQLSHILRMGYNFQEYLISTLKQLVLLGAVHGNLPLWFLFSLFLVKIFYNWIDLHKFLRPTLVAVISFIAVNFLYYTGLTKPYYVATFFSGLCFYSLGIVFKRRQYKIAVVIVALIYLYCNTAYLSTSVDMRINALAYGKYFLWYPYSLCGIIAVNNLSKYICSTTSFFDPVVKVVINVGKHSMGYYVVHWLLLSISVSLFTKYLGVPEGIPLFICVVLLLAILLPVINFALVKWIPWSVGITTNRKREDSLE